MKKLFILIAFLTLTLTGFANSTKARFHVDNATTPFGKILSVDTLIFNDATDEEFQVITKSLASETLTTASAKVESFGGGLGGSVTTNVLARGAGAGTLVDQAGRAEGRSLVGANGASGRQEGSVRPRSPADSATRD